MVSSSKSSTPIAFEPPASQEIIPDSQPIPPSDDEVKILSHSTTEKSQEELEAEQDGMPELVPSDSEEEDEDQETQEYVKKFVKSPRTHSQASSSTSTSRKKVKIPKKRPGMHDFLRFSYNVSYLESLRLSPHEAQSNLRSHSVSQVTKVLHGELEKKKKKKNKHKKKPRSQKKSQKRKRAESPDPDPDTVEDFVQKNKRRRKTKDTDTFTEVDKMKEIAVDILEQYTTTEFYFNPLHAGDPDELVGSRGLREPHVDKLYHEMKVKHSIFKKATMMIVFQNVSFFLSFFKM